MLYEIQDGQLKLALTDFGGALTSIHYAGREYLWSGDPQFWSGQAPILFPICGSLRDNHCLFRSAKNPETGQFLEGTMPRHGIVRKRDFELLTQDASSISFRFRSDEETKTSYPFDFELIVHYEVKGRTIQISHQVRNLSSVVTMPCFLGAHPGFKCPLENGQDFSDYYIEFPEDRQASLPRAITASGLIDSSDRRDLELTDGHLPLDYSSFVEEDTLIFDQLRSRSVRLRSKQSPHYVQVNFEDFKYLMVWTSGQGAPFIALEPWSGLSTCTDESDYFEDKANVTLIRPGQAKVWKYEIEVG